MNNKGQILDKLTEIFNRWQALLASLSEEQIIAPLVPSSWTVKDVITHLWTWQQASVAWMEAALHGREPEYPRWWQVLGPNPEEDVDRTNAWIYEVNRDRPWSSVYADWKTQFQHYLELTRQVPEKDMLEVGRYSWMGTYALAASCMGSMEHHEEHMDTLLTWLQEHGNMKTSR